MASLKLSTASDFARPTQLLAIADTEPSATFSPYGEHKIAGVLLTSIAAVRILSIDDQMPAGSRFGVSIANYSLSPENEVVCVIKTA
jgi:hypothetical protein